MKKLLAAVMAGLFSIAMVGGVYAGEAKGDMAKSDKAKDDDKKKAKGKKDEMKK